MAEPPTAELDVSGVRHETAAFFTRARETLLSDPSVAQSVKGVFQLHIHRGGGDWVIDLRPGSVDVRRGTVDSPTSTVAYASEAVFNDVVAGRTSVNKALMLRKVKVSGSLSQLGKMQAAMKKAAAARNAAIARDRARQAEFEHNLRQPEYLADRGGSGQRSESKLVWVDDDAVDACMKCQASFTLMRRRHHCRACGRIFCHDCSKSTYKGHRVCDWCAEKLKPRSRVLSMSPSANEGGAAATASAMTPSARPSTDLTAAVGGGGDGDSGGFSDNDGEEEDEAAARLKFLERSVTRLEKQLELQACMDRQALAPWQVADRDSFLRAIGMTMMLVLSMAGWKAVPLGLVVYAATGWLTNTLLFGWFSAVVYIMVAVAIWMVGSWALFRKIRRRLHTITLALLLWMDYRIVKLQTAALDDDDAQPVWDAAHVRNAKRMQEFCMDQQGLYVKLGQYLSTRSDIMPVPYLGILSKLQSGARSQPIEDVKKTLQEDLKRPVDELFAMLSPEPLATASIGQVHRGTLHDGREVAVKVQHRGVSDLLQQDLHNLMLALLMLRNLGSFDMESVIREWSKQLLTELDFSNEAASMTEISNHFRRSGLPVMLPEIYSNLSSSRVMTMQFINGERVTTADALRDLGVDVDKFVTTIVEALSYQMHIIGLFNGDPHPGNILVVQKKNVRLPEPAPGHRSPFDDLEDSDWIPVLLDYGLTIRVSQATRIAFSKFAVATESLDYGGVMDAHREMGLQLASESLMLDMAHSTYTFRRSAPASEARDRFKEYEAKRKLELLKLKMGDKQVKRLKAVPKDLLFYMRALELTHGLCSTLDTVHEVGATMSRIAQKALVERFPEDERQHPMIFPSPVTGPPELHTRLVKCIKRHLRVGELLGVQVAVVEGGVTVLDIAAGSMGRLDQRAVKPSTLFPCFGVSRLASAAALLALSKDRACSLSDTVCTYFPEFSPHGKDACTISQLLRCRSGIEGALPERLQTSAFAPDKITDSAVYAAEQEPLLLPPITEPQPLCGVELPPRHQSGPEPPQELISHLYYGWGWVVAKLLATLSPSGTAPAAVASHVAWPVDRKDEFMLGLSENTNDRLAGRIATVELFKISDTTDDDDTGSTDTDPRPAPSGLRRAPSRMPPVARSTSSGGASTGAASGAGGDAFNDGGGSGLGANLSETTVATALAALELGRIMKDAGLDALQDLQREGLTHFMDPRLVNNYRMQHGVLPSTGLLASARALASVAGHVGETLLKQALDDAGQGGAAARPPHVEAVHIACRDLGFRAYTFAHCATPSTHSGAGAGVSAGAGGGSTPGSPGTPCSTLGFGISAMGGSVVLSCPERHLSVAVTVNQLTPSRAVPLELLAIVCEQLGLGAPTNA